MKTKFTLLSAAAILMASCGGQTAKTVSVTGVAPDMEDGAEIVITNVVTGLTVDTVLVSGGAFKFEVPATESPIAMKANASIFMTDGASITLTSSPELGLVASGTALNDAWKSYVEATAKHNIAVRATMDALSEQYKDDQDKFREEYYKFYAEKVQPVSDSLFAAVFEPNKLSPIGVMLFSSSISKDTLPDLAQIDAYYAEYPAAKEYKQLAEYRQSILNLENTQPGAMFTDFTVRNIENTADAKLSDYVGKGKYVLVDFWASWCGPCKREIPNLKVVQDKYGKDNFTVIGVNVWDKHDAALEAIKEEGMNWPQLFDAKERESIATATYGVKGIPTLVLFAPDGTILNRTLRGEEMIRIVGETVTKK